MTAQTITGAAVAPRSADRRLAGLGALLRKDVTEWVRGRRAWVIAIVTTLFMVLTAANGWITNQIAANVPDGVEAPEVGSLVPLDNLFAAVGAQVWVLAAIFAVGSLIVAERQSGTLSWVASKPVSRSAIWVSKWLSVDGDARGLGRDRPDGGDGRPRRGRSTGSRRRPRSSGSRSG